MLRGPGYRLVNAVKLLLQSGRNTKDTEYEKKVPTDFSVLVVSRFLPVTTECC
jgi:hypothetical protein